MLEYVQIPIDAIKGGANVEYIDGETLIDGKVLLALDEEKILEEAMNEEGFPMELFNRIDAGGNSVKLFREHRGMSSSELADVAGLSRAYISQIEGGKRKGTAKTLQKIADVTNGKYFRATDTESLEGIYAEIDRLEKSKVEERQYVDYRELAVQPIHYGSMTIPPVALWAFLLLGLQMVLKNTFFREFG